ncbi:Starch-binding associating with outer membrane [Chitinophaga terrae (ex Kim and Jung 2007)]|uniref:Starch-binding associating with outer membrane n=1 Tax=Chitinophaga terrae (ex Kim and Jung 2007) TaxID=408074 RepID=A0A1H4FPS3_9BACT|nr:RagB/SusD family nutrient uptake outer membrane protein [Chitinophaga terrae (ex Kim and Jung 2007)]GEP92642.1 carbohydrate-binding protein [Chitinophaga terrae (ex Kim and Jung 2007)]SEA99294.1 Starch-binding associating with outer membrane [Chitinophaga terrae (ex Kim and Jung 2007)]
MKRNIIVLLASVFLLAGCKDLLVPEIENNQDLNGNYPANNAGLPFGILLNGYNRIPTNSWSFNDVATDDAVSNDQNNSFLKIANGQWTASNNPLNQWTNAYAAIQYLNIMLRDVDTVQWTADPVVSRLFRMRIKGEAYGLRALFYYHLLQAHAGVSESGAVLGVPLILEVQGPTADFNKPRASFEACMQQVYSDLNKADELLPLDYENVADPAFIPEKFGSVTREQYNRAFGAAFRGFLTGRIVKAIRSKAALLAASPAFNTGNATAWADAANYAGEVISLKGGINALASNGLTWYSNAAEIAGLADGANPNEILWRNNYGDNRDLEQANFPPSLFGNGRINPTQNLVDAFPMANGLPINSAGSGYDASNPYIGRDPRLRLFILVNGGTAGPNNIAINTAIDGPTNDALNKVETSTRTGYYLRKLLRQDVNLNPNSANNQRHYKPHIRYTEIFLNYAEAANEAWGPVGAGKYGYSAYDVIKAIRKRAGVGATNGDPYLEEAKGNKDQMRELIRNERRIELCFEGFRFWDLRRWKMTLSETAKGVSIRNNTPSIINVESRQFQPFMVYGPIPYGEILKFGALEQNKGWR